MDAVWAILSAGVGLVLLAIALYFGLSLALSLLGAFLGLVGVAVWFGFVVPIRFVVGLSRRLVKHGHQKQVAPPVPGPAPAAMRPLSERLSDFEFLLKGAAHDLCLTPEEFYDFLNPLTNSRQSEFVKRVGQIRRTFGITEDEAGVFLDQICGRRDHAMPFTYVKPEDGRRLLDIRNEERAEAVRKLKAAWDRKSAPLIEAQPAEPTDKPANNLGWVNDLLKEMGEEGKGRAA